MSFISTKSIKYRIEKDKYLFKLSFSLLKNLGYNIHFFGDDLSLKEFKEIPWDYKDNNLEKINKNYYRTWSIGKLHAINEACNNYENFFHIDGDIFIFDYLPDNLSQNVICFDKEPIYNFNRLYQNCNFIPDELKILPKQAYNMSFFGGPSCLLKKYITDCLNFVLHIDNQNFFQNPKEIDTLLAILAEQGYFACYSNFFDIKIKTIQEDFKLNNIVQHIRLQYSDISTEYYSNIEKLKNIVTIYNKIGGMNNIENFNKLFN